MSRILPHPVLAFFLFLMWLLLNQSVSPGHVVLGAAVAVLAAWATALIEPKPVRFRVSIEMARLLLRVLGDILRSNAAVARIILRRGRLRHTSGFVSVPLMIKSNHALAALAVIITATPGTLWMQYDPQRGMLLIHVLDLVDRAYWVNRIKTRYERSLLEIFE